MFDLSSALDGLVCDLRNVESVHTYIMENPYEGLECIEAIEQYYIKLWHYDEEFKLIRTLMYANSRFLEIAYLLERVSKALTIMKIRAMDLHKYYQDTVNLPSTVTYWGLVGRIRDIMQPLMNCYYDDIIRLLHLLDIVQKQSIRKRPRPSPTNRDCAPPTKKPRNK